jgi:hypothetical protein
MRTFHVSFFFLLPLRGWHLVSTSPLHPYVCYAPTTWRLMRWCSPVVLLCYIFSPWSSCAPHPFRLSWKNHPTNVLRIHVMMFVLLIFLRADILFYTSVLHWWKIKFHTIKHKTILAFRWNTRR